jgi:hypothetical protein
VPGPVKLSRIFYQQFSPAAILLCLQFYLLGAFRYRAVARIVEIASTAISWLDAPCFNSIRNWVMRLGCYRLQSARTGPRWALICDHTAAFAGGKLFIMAAVDLDMLERRVADGSGNFSLQPSDLCPLAVVPMKHSSGEILLEKFLNCFQTHGHPEQIITDGGADILKSVRLLQAHQVELGIPPTRHAYDISHRIARLVEDALATDELWLKMEAIVTQARSYCKYRARHLSPADLRRGPDRWMNLSGIVDWFQRIKIRLAALTPNAEGSVDDAQREQPKQTPRIGYTQRVWQSVKDVYSKSRDGIFSRLKALCGKEFADEASFEAALQAKCPKLPSCVAEMLGRNKDLNRSYLIEISEGCDECWEKVEEIAGMLEFTHAIQKQLKLAGLTKAGVEVCQGIHDAGKLQGVGLEVGARVMEMIRRMGQDLGEQARVIVSSDVIESINGRWKMLIGGSAMPALGRNALLVPMLMGEITEEEITQALQTTSMKDLDDWSTENIGVSYHQEKRMKKRVKSPEILQEVVF